MSGKTGIAWSDMTWNPTIGCKRVSAGCDHCYAFQLHDQRHIAWKRGRWNSAPTQYHLPFSKVQLMPERIEDPLHWRKPRRVFVNSMSDLFHEDVPGSFINQVWNTMFNARHHTYQILTKRPERLLEWTRTKAAYTHWPIEDIWPDWIWLGVSVENQQAADERIPLLLQTPAAVRFLSCEPLLGPVDLVPWLKLGWVCELCHRRDTSRSLPDGWELVLQSAVCHECRELARVNGGIMNAYGGMFAQGPDPRPWRSGLHWIIVGGESGAHSRPMDLAWVESLVEQCQYPHLPVFVKQLGTVWAKASHAKEHHGGDIVEWPEALRIREFPQTREAVHSA